VEFGQDAAVSERATVMLVHGAWHGSWCWDEVRGHLADAGIGTVAVDLPSVAAPGSDLRADVDRVRAALDATTGPVVLVGHSYGGAVVSDAAGHPTVVHTVFLTAFPLEPGESITANALTGGEDMNLEEALIFDGDSVSVDPTRAVHFFFHDRTESMAGTARDRLRLMSVAAMVGTVQSAGWRDKPSTYVVCTDDHALPVALQRSGSARADRVVDVRASHSPFLSRPVDVARVIADIVSGLTRR
jgi:pimeloyl-ACP methyl ester carboxylesterase